MTNPFLTLEDINGTLFSNQSFWWYEIDTSNLPSEPFENIKYDFCKISKEEDTFFLSLIIFINVLSTTPSPA